MDWDMIEMKREVAKMADIKVRCHCGWQGKQSELVAVRTCPNCSAVFEAWPFNALAARQDSPTVEIIDAIVAGIGSDDSATDQAMAIVENLKRAGYVIVAPKAGD